MTSTAQASVDRLPVSIIGGYLGAGKTTLVNHLLREANGLRLAVLVNEFGELPIDSDLIESQDDNVISIAGGCVCCSYGNDLILAMMDLAKMTPRPEHVLLEASGVALPGAIASSIGLLQDYALDSVIVLADAETVHASATDRYMADTIERQLAAADIVVLNKIDLVSGPCGQATLAWLADGFPRARIVSAAHAKLPPAVVLQSFAGRRRLDHASSPHRVDRFETTTITVQEAVDATQLARQLAEPELGLLRAKGFVKTAGGAFAAIQVVGCRYEISPAAAPAQTGIVCIGLKHQLNREALARIRHRFA